MSKNSRNVEGPYLASPQNRPMLSKNPLGLTRIRLGTRPIIHGDGPMTPTTDRENWGVNPKPAKK